MKMGAKSLPKLWLVDLRLKSVINVSINISSTVKHKSQFAMQVYTLAWHVNPLTPELNPSTQRCLRQFLLGISVFEGLTVRRIYRSFGIEGLIKN
jgi:hypothetical protein